MKLQQKIAEYKYAYEKANVEWAAEQVRGVHRRWYHEARRWFCPSPHANSSRTLVRKEQKRSTICSTFVGGPGPQTRHHFSYESNGPIVIVYLPNPDQDEIERSRGGLRDIDEASIHRVAPDAPRSWAFAQPQLRHQSTWVFQQSQLRRQSRQSSPWSRSYPSQSMGQVSIHERAQ